VVALPVSRARRDRWERSFESDWAGMTEFLPRKAALGNGLNGVIGIGNLGATTEHEFFHPVASIPVKRPQKPDAQ
jgi:hypothetical protein